MHVCQAADCAALLTFAATPQTPVTSSPVVAGFLSNLPAYRIGVSPLLRGVEIGLVHGFLAAGQQPFPDGASLWPLHASSMSHPCEATASILPALEECSIL